MKKKKNIFQARYVVLLGMVVISAIAIRAIYQEINTTFSLNAQIDEASKVKASLDQEKTSLNKKKNNLNNRDYIVRYARGKYMVTKEDGEQVFKLPKEDK